MKTGTTIPGEDTVTAHGGRTDARWHIYTSERGVRYDVLKMQRVVADREPERWHIHDLFGFSHKDAGFDLARYEVADTTEPIIVTLLGRVLDGNHRVLKAIYSYKDNGIAARTITKKELAQCRIGEGKQCQTKKR